MYISQESEQKEQSATYELSSECEIISIGSTGLFPEPHDTNIPEKSTDLKASDQESVDQSESGLMSIFVLVLTFLHLSTLW